MLRSAALSGRVPSRFDVAIAAVLLVLVEVDIWVSDVGGPRAVTMTCGAVGAVAVAWRNIAPVPVAWVVAAALVAPLFAGTPKEDGAASVLPILFAMFALGQVSQRDPSRRLAAYATIAGTVALAWAANVYQDGLGGGDFLYVGAFAVVPYLFGRAVGASRTDSERNARRADEAIREREAARATAVADERLRIARELHDVISHSVSLMGIQAGAARKVLPQGLEEVETSLRSIEAVGRQTLDEMRRLLGVMREGAGAPAQRGPQPGLLALDELAAQTEAAGVPVSMTVDVGDAELAPGLDLAAYRIVQEALTNVRRHAPGRPAEVSLRRRGDVLEIRVSNPLPADAPPAGAGHGLIGMQERAALYDGSLSAGPEGGRFVVRSALPVGVASAPVLAPAEG